MPPQIRVELYLPTHYNPKEDGTRTPIESSKFRKLKNKIVDKYGGISKYPSTIEGIWVNRNAEGRPRYYDNCYKFEVCIDFKEDFEKELEELKEELKKEFKQYEIYLVHYSINWI